MRAASSSCHSQRSTENTPERLIGVAEAAELLSVSEDFIRSAVHRGIRHPGTGVRCYRLGAHGRVWRFRPSELLEDLCKMRPKGRPRKRSF